MVGSPAVYSLARVRSDRALFRPDRVRVRLPGRTDERARRYSAGVAVVASSFLTGAVLAAAFGAGFVGFRGG